MASDLMRILILATIASSVAMLLALVLRKPMRVRFGARAAYALWILVPLSAMVFTLPAPVASLSTPVVSAITTALATATPAAVLPAMDPFDPSPWLAAAWLLGVGIVCLLFVRQQHCFVRRLGKLSPAGDETLRAQTTAGCPALLGAWRPRVVVPVDFEQRYSSSERELILAHERTHRARGDAQVNALAAVLRCVFWFNPLIHFVASHFRFDQELACDAVVICRFPEARRSYADAMLKTQLAEFGLPVGCHWQSSHPLKERITMLKQPMPGRARSALGAAVAVALVVGGTYAAWAAQPAAPAAIKNADANSIGTSLTSAADSRTADSKTADSKTGYRALRPIAYPAAAVAARLQGVVYVSAHIAADGSVANAHVNHIDPPTADLLADAAVAGVKTWTFDPARRNGKDIASDEIVPVVFALDPGGDAPRVERTELEPVSIAPQTPKSMADAPPSEKVSYRMMFPLKYPEAAIHAKQSARLTFNVLVDEQGVPKSVAVQHCEPEEAAPMFAQASIDAIKKWRFNPGIKDGKPYAGHIEVPIDFVISDDDS